MEIKSIAAGWTKPSKPVQISLADSNNFTSYQRMVYDAIKVMVVDISIANFFLLNYSVYNLSIKKNRRHQPLTKQWEELNCIKSWSKPIE